MSAKSFTETQGQYLAFIDAYTRVHGRPPAETDMQRRFRVSPSSVHQMVLTLERLGLIRRQPGVARSIEVLFAPEAKTCPSYAIPNPSNPLCRGTSSHCSRCPLSRARERQRAAAHIVIGTVRVPVRR